MCILRNCNYHGHQSLFGLEVVKETDFELQKHSRQYKLTMFENQSKCLILIIHERSELLSKVFQEVFTQRNR